LNCKIAKWNVLQKNNHILGFPAHTCGVPGQFLDPSKLASVFDEMAKYSFLGTFLRLLEENGIKDEVICHF